jgi:magnesium chelatase family protein
MKKESFMKRTKKQASELSLFELLQEVQSKVNAEILPAGQQSYVLQVVIDMLQACGKSVERPLPGQDMQEVRGQAHVKRALEIAAAGGHNILLVGSPGAGRTMLARTLPSLLPATSLPYPFREPPSSIEQDAFIGAPSIPGESTLAHGGVLFLKEFDTFDLSLLTSLAQAVETHTVSIPFEETSVVFPAKFILTATIKPCPCGFLGDTVIPCRCSTEEIALYRQRYQEIIRTCFAIEIEVPCIGEEILRKHTEESSASVRQRVEVAREIQQRRYAEETHLWVNADLRSADEVQHYCQIDSSGEELLEGALRQLHLTPLEVLRVQGVARTIADLAESPVIAARYLAEAIQYLSRFMR